MTKILTVRLPPDLHEKAGARAARLGVDRAKYVRALIEEDISGSDGKPSRHFGSEDLIGLYGGDGIRATNSAVRERLRSRVSTGK